MGFFGIVPQCGFSVSVTNLFSARVVSLGTLISVYLTTSDEMLPILISKSVSLSTIFYILGIKVIIGVLAGLLIDIVIRKNKKIENYKIADICEDEHCHCEGGILKSTLKHTVSIFIFIFVFNLILNAIIEIVGHDVLKNSILNMPIIGNILAGLIGLIPNCAASVVLTELYVGNIVKMSTMITGLLVNTGIGTVVLFRTNKNLKENIKIIALTYGISVVCGIILGAIGI